MTTPFRSEAEFEAALIDLLTRHGWNKELLRFPTEQQLIDNWADILFANNRGRDLLGDVPLTEGEMAQIIEQVNNLRTPLALNEFINNAINQRVNFTNIETFPPRTLFLGNRLYTHLKEIIRRFVVRNCIFLICSVELLECLGGGFEEFCEFFYRDVFFLKKLFESKHYFLPFRLFDLFLLYNKIEWLVTKKNTP